MQKSIDQPRSLKDGAAREYRHMMLQQSHIQPLTAFVDQLNGQKRYGAVPYFDPMDGGINARTLFLFEKPGPKAFDSGFISRNNNDQTAENTFKFMQQAHLPRQETCIWNTVPGWNGQVKITTPELKAGIECLHEVFSLLQQLEVLVLVGLKAQSIEDKIGLPKLKIIKSFHPSPVTYATSPDKWHAIPVEWAKVCSYLA